MDLFAFQILIVKSGSEISHTVLVTAYRTGSRITARDDLAKDRQIRINIKESLCTR